MTGLRLIHKNTHQYSLNLLKMLSACVDSNEAKEEKFREF